MNNNFPGWMCIATKLCVTHFYSDTITFRFISKSTTITTIALSLAALLGIMYSMWKAKIGTD